MKLPQIKSNLLSVWRNASDGRMKYHQLRTVYLDIRTYRRQLDRSTSSHWNDSHVDINLSRILKQHGVKIGPRCSRGPWYIKGEAA